MEYTEAVWVPARIFILIYFEFGLYVARSAACISFYILAHDPSRHVWFRSSLYISDKNAGLGLIDFTLSVP